VRVRVRVGVEVCAAAYEIQQDIRIKAKTAFDKYLSMIWK
jgi:hypothetical protein